MEVSSFAGIAGKKKEVFENWTLERQTSGKKLPKGKQSSSLSAHKLPKIGMGVINGRYPLYFVRNKEVFR